MSLFHAFHAVAFKEGKTDGSLIVLRDQELDYKGVVWFLAGEIPDEICQGRKIALDYMREHGKAAAVLGFIDGEAVVRPPMVAQKIENTEVMVRGKFSNSKVEAASFKLFEKMDVIEQCRFCSLDQMLALHVSAKLKEVIKPGMKDEEIISTTKQLNDTAKQSLQKQLTNNQLQMLQKRLGTNTGIDLPKLIPSEVPTKVDDKKVISEEKDPVIATSNGKVK